MIDIVDRLKFDSVRCEVQFSKGVASNIDEGIAEIGRLRAALRDIVGWKNDTLGQRPREPGHWAPEAELDAFDRGTRMAFFRCASHAETALALSPASAALTPGSPMREGK